MKVLLINNPENEFPLVPYIAARTSRGANYEDLVKDSKEKMLSTLQHCAENMHLSVFEHVYFSFMIEETSRFTLDQLNRYRVASVCMESCRKSDISTNPIYLAQSIENDPRLAELVRSHVRSTGALYKELIDNRIPPEDARTIVEIGRTTKEVFTCNLREFFHIRKERLCTTAYPEIRQLVKFMSLSVLSRVQSLNGILELFKPDCRNCKHPCNPKEESK